MYDALYGRQSLEKEDSISIESQFEYCKHEVQDNAYKTYKDKGFSGKNTRRPDFERMMADIESGIISRVIVYKLDRISRSVLDFCNMMDTFQKHGVEFVSTKEKFDTSTPIGRAMLNICIVFAQLERETTQARVADNYQSRCKVGLYMGGRVSYGFSLVPTEIQGIKTKMYQELPEESEQIKLMCQLYANAETSLGDVLSYFLEHHVEHLRGNVWSTPRVSEIMRNPVYVKADAEVYNFYKSQGADIINPIEAFNGEHGCYLYKKPNATTNKSTILSETMLVLAPHKGLVDSDTWLKCRIKCLNNRQSTKTCKPKNSWLAGKVKCGNCGYALTIRKSNTKWKRYFVCSYIKSTARCKGTGGTVYADLLEQYLFEAIKARLKEFKVLTNEEAKKSDLEVNAKKIQIAKVDREIDELLAKVNDATPVLMQYINQKVDELDSERRRLQEDVLSLATMFQSNNIDYISNHVEIWKDVSFEDKQAVVDMMIKVIHIADGKIDITWRI